MLQDWLAQMQDHLNILQTDVTIGERFMYNMGRGAKVNDLTIETCTTYPRHNLASLTMDTVTFVCGRGEGKGEGRGELKVTARFIITVSVFAQIIILHDSSTTLGEMSINS